MVNGPEAFELLTPDQQTAVAAAVGRIVGTFVSAAAKSALGDPQKRAVEDALQSAVAEVVSEHAAFDDVGIEQYIGSPPVSDLIVDVVENPTEELDKVAVSEAIEAAGLDFSPLEISAVELIEDIRRKLIRELRSRPEAQQLYGVARLDQVHASVEELHRKWDRAHGKAPGGTGNPMAPVPGIPSWSDESLRGLLRQAREALAEGRTGEAEPLFRKQLEEVRRARTEVGRHHPEDEAARRHEQETLLGLAQLEYRRLRQRKAVELVREAEALGELEGRARFYAGWVFLNLDEVEEALQRLVPPGDSSDWVRTAAIAHLMAGDWESFTDLIGDPSEVENADVLLALVRHHATKNQLAQAEHFAHRLAVDAESGPVQLARAVEAASLLVTQFAWSEQPEVIDVEGWLEQLRSWFDDANDLDGPHLFLRREVLWHEVSVRLAVLDTAAASDTWRELAQIAPSDAARFVAMAPLEVESQEIEALQGMSPDPATDALLHVQLLVRKEDFHGATRRLAQMELADDDPRRDQVDALRLELESRAEGDLKTLLREADEIEDPVIRCLVTASLYNASNREDKALSVLRESLEERGDDIRLLRAALIDAGRMVSQAGPDRSDEASDWLLDVADRLVARLACPEHRLLRARALQAAGRLPDALAQLRAVEESGYITEELVRLTADLTGQLRRPTEHASALRCLYQRFDQSDRVGIQAAQSSLAAGEHEEARALLEVLRDSESEEVAVAAWKMLSLVVEAMEATREAGQEAAAQVLLEAYDTLDGPVDLALPLFWRASDTSLSGEAARRIERDFGSLDKLPGIVAKSTDEFIELIQKGRDEAKVRMDLLLAGILPFERYAEASPRSASYLWFAHRTARTPQVLTPPRPLEADRDVSSVLPPLLLDRTSLLLLAEVGIVETVLESQLELLLHRDDFDWLKREEIEVRETYRATEHERVKSLLRIIEEATELSIAQLDSNDQSFWDAVSEAGGGGDAVEAAIARRDGLLLLDDHADQEIVNLMNVSVIDSATALNALTPTVVTYEQAQEAVKTTPQIFADPTSASVELSNTQVLVGASTLRSWHKAGLLRPLMNAADRIVISPVSTRHLIDNSQELASYASALDALEKLNEVVPSAVEVGRIELVGIASADDGDQHESEAPRESQGRDGEAAPSEDQVSGWLTQPLERRYLAALQAEAAVWTDDAATHLYQSPIGSLVPGERLAQEENSRLRSEYPGLRTTSTADVLKWLETQRKITHERRIEILLDLTRHGRILLSPEEVVTSEALSLAREERKGEESALEVLSQATEALPEIIVPRFLPALISAVAGALQAIADEDVSSAGTKNAVSSLAKLIESWLSHAGDRRRTGGRMFWQMAAVQLLGRPRSRVTDVFKHLIDPPENRDERRRLLRLTVWAALEQLAELAENPDIPLLAVADEFQALAESVQGSEVDNRPVIPVQVLQTALPIGGLDLHLENVAEVQIDGRTLTVQYSDREAEAEATRAMEEFAARRRAEGNPVPIDSAYWVPVEVTADVIGEDRSQTIRARVPIPRILHTVGRDARADLIGVLHSHYQVAAPELAQTLERHRKDFERAADEDVDRVRRDFLREQLELPRTWVEADLFRFFLALRESSFSVLQAMAGAPEMWHTGESLETYLARVLPGDDAKSDAQRLSVFWGPFEPVIRRQLDLVQGLSAPEVTEMRALAQQTLLSAEPYTRIFSLAALVQILTRFPDLQAVPVTDEEDVEEENPWSDVSLGEVIRELLVSHVWSWTDEDREGGRQEVMGTIKRVVERSENLRDVHARVTVAVFRQALAPNHETELKEVADGLEYQIDPLGTLLLLGHQLTSVVYGMLLERTPDFEPLIDELDLILDQFPLSDSRFPVSERMQPELFGLSEDSVDPYRLTLLSLLKGVALGFVSARQQEDERDESEIPFFWCHELEAGLQSFVVQSSTQGSRAVERNLSEGNRDDRFGMLYGRNAADRADALLDLFSEAESGSDAADQE